MSSAKNILGALADTPGCQLPSAPKPEQGAGGQGFEKEKQMQ